MAIIIIVDTSFEKEISGEIVIVWIFFCVFIEFHMVELEIIQM